MEDSTVFAILISCCAILGVFIILCMVRAVKGPRFTDRIVAVNAISTMTIIIMCILSVCLKQDFLVDIAIVYALLGFIAVVVLTRLVTVRRRAQEKKERDALLAHKQAKKQKGA